MIFAYRSQTSNGISASEQGRLIQARSAEQSAAYVVQGQYSYIGADGQQYSVRYSADENGEYKMKSMNIFCMCNDLIFIVFCSI